MVLGEEITYGVCTHNMRVRVFIEHNKVHMYFIHWGKEDHMPLSHIAQV